jgi:hypothetical protein
VSGMSKHYETPTAGKENKFVVTDDRAWFLPFEDKATAPAFAESSSGYCASTSQTRSSWRR